MKNVAKVLILFILSIINVVNAQEVFRLKESIGMPLRSRSYIDLKGSPYFVDIWSKGLVKQSNGQKLRDIDLKYDQLQDELIFKNTDGRELGFAVPVTEFKISYIINGSTKSSIFRNGFEPFKGSTAQNYYEILYEGKLSLAKKNVKRIEEYREYNSATITKSIIERVKYYYYKANKLSEFKRDTNSIKEAFGDHADSLLTYIRENKLDLKNDMDLIKIFDYYSTQVN
ncbi:hypothetical protein SAMN04488511_103302 [Pedobacter suwonensis]|uniref:Uncharacterized protein n=1 Tax=Pedobacter suwonensis TaxID=332999 RepID=A0A1I0SUT6_9SPHI|nr:hypothetical protein [Pedobacter suwonensis]SFA43274.1 hypothetical protein SAMN04488511_103302 [Pedobacter suwonensis]